MNAYLLAIGLGLAFQRAEARGPARLTGQECLSLMGGAVCSQGQMNCGCNNTIACSTAGCSNTDAPATCSTNPAGGCYQLQTTNQNECGQVNNTFPKGCTQTVDQDVKCANYYVNPSPSNPCTYPNICTADIKPVNCGAQKTTCAQN